MSQTFIRAFDNKNRPILAGNKPVERIHFNLVRLMAGEDYRYRLADFESVVVPLAGTCDLAVVGEFFSNLGRRAPYWGGRCVVVIAGPKPGITIRYTCSSAIALYV